MIDSSVPVVVLCRPGDAAVAIARSLGRLGVPVHLVAQEDAHIADRSSRYWTRKFSWDFARPEQESVAFLHDIGAAIRADHGSPAILLTLSDWVAIFIERNSESLGRQFRFPQPERPVIRALLNKWEMHLLAQEHDIPTPAAVHPASMDEIDEFLERTGFPIVMKAAERFVAGRPPTRILHARGQLLEELGGRDPGRDSLNVILQEYIPGDTDTVWMCNGYFGSDPDRDVTFTGKKLRQQPAGIATLAVCAPNATVESQTRRFMRGVGYRGCVGIGWRFDSRDGLYKLLDVNARVSGIFRLFEGTNEMDVARVCYLDLTGQEIPVTTLRPGRKWVREEDFSVAAGSVRGGRLTMSGWARSLRGVRERHWLAVDDPLPFFAHLGGALRRRASLSRAREQRAR